MEYQGYAAATPRTIPCPDGLVRRLLCLGGKIDVYNKIRKLEIKAERG